MSTTISGTDGVSKVSDDAITDQGLYDKENILGIVSESGGVPTGAIIESGSNANGEYTKYADGTLVCTHAQATSASAAVLWTFPTAFSSADVIIGITPVSGTTTSLAGKVSNGSGNGVEFAIIQATNVRILATAQLSAIGRWF
jgi:hypothetical protein